MKEVYLLASQYWGEGLGAQEVVIARNRFDAIDHNYLSGFFALDLLGEAANFPNFQNELAGTNASLPSINQNIIVADNDFTIDEPRAIINVSSVNNVLFYRNRIDLLGRTARVDTAASLDGLTSEPAQFPVTIHDASNVYFEGTRTSESYFDHLSCRGSIMEQLSDPSPLVTAAPPLACEISATSSHIGFGSYWRATEPAYRQTEVRTPNSGD